MGTYIDAAIRILEESGKPLHYKDITRRAIERGLIMPRGRTPTDSMHSRISTYIRSGRANPTLCKVRAGVFGLDATNPVEAPTKHDPSGNAEDSRQAAPTHGFRDKRHIRKGGEYLVAGRLILHGYNASLLSVDGGLDLVAVRDDGKMYGIQVKTANESSIGYLADISVGAYERTGASATFYVDWTPFMETDFANILFTPIASRYIKYGALRVLSVPFGELGGGQVLQGRMDSVLVVVLECGIQRLLSLVDVGKLPRPDVLFFERLVE